MSFLSSKIFQRGIISSRLLSINPILPLSFKSITYSNIRYNSSSTIKQSKPVTIDRELPDPLKDQFADRLKFFIFVTLMGISSVLIFNYEKINSPIVTTTLHFLRRSQIIREVLGDHIDFATLVPWVKGELNQVKGKVDIKFSVKGSKNNGIITLIADREDRYSDFLIHQWNLTVDGKTYDLLEDKTVDFAV
ncbi:hypothetical protein WICMUC_002850 [Wickerhamomyces mucosus]|uniref:Cytochrome c oxidase assembly factor 1 n=1 Tax=Wickerhamomyces mucosus TaxID=1378264 RepID=A0A9P8TD22_9ASCO|nr:hypothetical protein WICMUC_002850 [Wickerhamomyces mucosus]